MDIFKYLNQMGIDTVDRGFYGKIEDWKSWYYGNVPRFHRYKIYQGRNNIIKCKRKSLGMAKTACEDIANLLLNEKVTYTIAGQAGDIAYDYVKKVLEGAGWDVNGNQFQEWKAAVGTVAYVPYTDMEVDAEGIPISGTVKVDYVLAENIFPITWENGSITECAFTFPHIIGGKKYVHIQFHQKNGDDLYVITNKVLKSQSGKSWGGRELKPAEYHALSPFKNLVESIETGSDKPQFVIDKLAICNNADPTDTSNPMGIAIFANALDILESIDTKYDSYNNEFRLGRKRIFVSPEMLHFADGGPAFDPEDDVFYELPEDYFSNTKEAIHESNMTLRTGEHSQAITDDLNYFSQKCGFGKNHYKFTEGAVQTATAVISENSDLYRTVCKHEIILRKVLEDLIRIILRLGVQMNEPGLTEDVDITIAFDDSIIEDTNAERTRDRAEVAAGLMRREEYRAKWYGETEEQAEQRLPEQNSGIMV